MGRPRKSENRHLPPGVYLEKGRYVHRVRINGKLQSGVRLGKENDPLSKIWAAYEALSPKREMTLNDLVSQYQRSEKYQSLAVKTRKSIESAMRQILNQPLSSGDPFGAIPVAAITPGTIRKYLDRKKESPVAANREVAYLSSAFSWAYERDIVSANPCKGVRKNTEHARTRYVTDEEYRRVYSLAKEGPYYVCLAMEMAYLCRMRISEVLAAKW
ncbi:hypothetical protein JKG47_21540, partial [Acidithiobacillus sp. MC6.1]|nr:hypothetical protein [Acidithiobacillus sp. MC6.1]